METSNTLNICITGGAGRIAYALVPQIASGQVFGPNVKVNLRLLDLPQLKNELERVVLELQDVTYETLESVQIGDDPDVLFKDCDVAIFLGGATRKPGQERKDLLKINGKIFADQGKSLDKVAKKSVHCLVIANPSNTNCLILQANAPSIDKSNFTSLARLDQNRAWNHIALKAKVPCNQVKGVFVWGNHSKCQYPDIDHGTINGEPIRKVINDDKFIEDEYTKRVQDRGMEIIKVSQHGSVFSAASAIRDHLRDWFLGSEAVLSMGVTSEGDYDVPKDLIFSFPVKCLGGWKYEIVKDLTLSEYCKARIADNVKELSEEKTIYEDTLKN